MKMIPLPGIFNRLTGWLAGLACLIVTLPVCAQSSTTTTQPGPLPAPITLTTRLSTAVKPYQVLTAMRRVADWQLAYPFTNSLSTDWQLGAEYAGMMALAGISGDVKYRNAMLAMGENNQWQPGPRPYSADDHCIGQTYAELYLLYRENKMIAPLRERFDLILSNPPDALGLGFTQPQGKALEVWSWCDSLFMGPPTWLRLYTATGDERYLDFAVTNWWRTTDYLYDTNEHLFYRDSTYFDKRETNGQKIFWSRGNGWVMAGLVRTLQYLPTNHPDRSRFEQLFKDMAAKVLALQQPNGLWRASLLDPSDYPEKETSGSAFFIYALAWGVNQGLLDRMKELPIRKGWAALVDCVDADGKLTQVQPVGSDPKKFADDSTAPYGVGGFLLAGSEVYRMAVLHGASTPLPATIPLIKMENVPLFIAIQDLARQAHIKYILDPNTGYQPTTYENGRGGSLAVDQGEPTVSSRWTNSTADHALRELLKEHDLRMEQNPDDGVFRISAKEAGSRRRIQHESGAISTNTIPINDPGRPGQPIDGVTFLEQISCPVKVANPADFFRHCETVEVNLNDVQANRFWNTEVRFLVMDGVSSRILDSQIYAPETNEDKLLFQVDLAPHETRTYYVLDASTLAVVPRPIVKTFARHVPERYDDFAWESDRIAHRAYGLALIPAEGTISSAPDVWIKKDRGLIVDTMYKTGHYHEDNGSFMDDYRVGHSRGCGGLGIWDGKNLYTSSNYHNWKLITTGPIRSEFELTYDAWDAGHARMVSETKRYSIDAGSWLTKAQTTLNSDEKSPLTIGVGLAERACPTNREQFIADNQSEGWMSYWQPEDKPKGIIGVAIVLPKGSVETFTNDAPDMPESKLHAPVPQPTHEGYPPIRNQLAITQVEVGKPFTYYFGACWDRSGDFTNAVQWGDYVKRFAERRDQPLRVTVGN